ncbi:CPBP family intramembrane glutamic endopeptidase [Nonomuraea sediminis]|uniref:CPBP family intramembrane glutamic endopeptidase n=1 Tax=Nonomuraea sediminis TaxID=2835864 RepID=UPI001BDC489D|nr:CPBP family intramembrane glutamic endopeptidase [Nonomuraea sediminis]
MIRFFALVFVLALPLWGAGALLGNLPGSPMNLPVGALMFPCPLIAAAILLRRRGGGGAIKRLLRSAYLAKGLRRAPWLAVTVLLVPAIYLLAYGVALLTGPLDGQHSPLLAAPLLFAVFFLAAVGEETGWMGYAADPLQQRWGALGAGLILGTVWGAWHIVPLVQAGRSPVWIAWWFVGTVATRMVIVWLYNAAGGSVLSAIIFHAMLNVMPSLLPGYVESELLVACTALVTVLVAAALFAFSPRPPAMSSWRPAAGSRGSTS